MHVSPNQQRPLRFSLRTLCLAVAAVAVFFGVAQWTDYLTAAGTLLGVVPLTIGVAYRRSPDTLVFCLFLTGWILPSIIPEYAVAFGANGHRNPDYFWLHVYLGEAGFFSRGITLEHTWEGTHGHSWPIGPWIPGYLLSMGVLSAGAFTLCYLRRVSKAIIYLAVVIRPLLVVLAFYSFMFDGWWFCAFAGSGYVAYVLFAFFYRRRIKGDEESTRLRKLAGLALVFYPWWVLSLALAQKVLPFFGWLATFSACLILLFGPESWFRQQSMAAEPLRGRFRLLFGVRSVNRINS